MAIIVRRPWTEQPQGCVNAGSQTLHFGLPESSSGARFTVVGAAKSVGRQGAGWLFSSNSHRVDVSEFQTFTGGKSFAILVAGELRAAPADGQTLFQILGTSGLNNRIEIYVRPSGQIRADVFSPSGGATTRDSVNSITQGAPFAYVLWARGGLVTSFLNGVSSATSGMTIPNANQTSYSIGGRTSNTFGFPGVITAHAIFAGEQVDAQGISANPWQLFEPRRIWVPVSAAAGGGYTLTLDAGAYALSGQSAALGVSRALSAAAGSYAVAGQAAALKASRALTAAAGSYALAGQAASFRVSRALALATGSYALSGSAATLTYTSGSTTYSLALDAGSYAVSGAAAGLLVGRVLLPAVGAYSVSGKAAAMVYSGSTAISTMPPYITVYMFKRTA